MAKTGRKSSVLATVSAAGAILNRRPEPPAELSEEAATEWRAVVGGLPTDWFSREQIPLLTQYVRHVMAARRLGQLIAQQEADPAFDAKIWHKHLEAQRKESTAMVNLATRLRLTNQSRYAARTAQRQVDGASPDGKKPWEVV